MTPVQIYGISAILGGLGILFALKLAEQMVPGSRPGIPVWGLLTLGGLAGFAGLATLFPWQASGNFVSEGWPCAVMELAIVIPAVAVFWVLARKGALFPSAGLGATLTGLAVFLAVIPLQLHCMFQRAPPSPGLAWRNRLADSRARSIRRISAVVSLEFLTTADAALDFLCISTIFEVLRKEGA